MLSNVGKKLQKVIILKLATELTQNDLGSCPAQHVHVKCKLHFIWKWIKQIYQD